MSLLAALEIKVPPRPRHASPEADTSLAPSSKNINRMGPNKTGPVWSQDLVHALQPQDTAGWTVA